MATPYCCALLRVLARGVEHAFHGADEIGDGDGERRAPELRSIAAASTASPIGVLGASATTVTARERAGEVGRRRGVGDGATSTIRAGGVAVGREQEPARHPRAVDRDAFGRTAGGHDREIERASGRAPPRCRRRRAPRPRAGRDRRRPPGRGTACRPRPGPAPGPRSPRRRRTRAAPSSSPGPAELEPSRDSRRRRRGGPAGRASSRSPTVRGPRSATQRGRRATAARPARASSGCPLLAGRLPGLTRRSLGRRRSATGRARCRGRSRRCAA